jgi:V/A-type H+-transporting ATPase subunit A
MENNKGTIVGINGNLLRVEFMTPVVQNEVAYARRGELELKAEVIRVRGRHAELQVFEDTTDLRVGDSVQFTSELLSAELGPGLLGSIYDGLQNPLPELAEKCGFFLQRGMYFKSLNREKKWAFTAVAKAGDMLEAGDTVGTVPEGIFTHRIMLPFSWNGRYRVCLLYTSPSPRDRG